MLLLNVIFENLIAIDCFVYIPSLPSGILSVLTFKNNFLQMNIYFIFSK